MEIVAAGTEPLRELIGAMHSKLPAGRACAAQARAQRLTAAGSAPRALCSRC